MAESDLRPVPQNRRGGGERGRLEIEQVGRTAQDAVLAAPVGGDEDEQALHVLGKHPDVTQQCVAEAIRERERRGERRRAAELRERQTPYDLQQRQWVSLEFRDQACADLVRKRGLDGQAEEL